MGNGKILRGGVGSGKTRTAIAYYFIKECEGKIKINGQGGYSPMKKPKDLYVITTPYKRDTRDWEQECVPFLISSDPGCSVSGVKLTVDSWNNIGKYVDVSDQFFIFDEQRAIGSGSWAKFFIKIAKKNRWIMLSATPGDVWMDYVPVFLANNFYKNRTEFTREHVVYNKFCKYPKVDRYINTDRLVRQRNQILVRMVFNRNTVSHSKDVIVDYDKDTYNTILMKRWNPYENEPIKQISALCYLMRRCVNSSPSRVDALRDILEKYNKVIVFYNLNTELDILRVFAESTGIPCAEWNGQKHEQIPKTNKWIYLVQYAAGAEGWNCIETNVIVFYSLSYSYKMMIQAAGRIDRLNTPFSDLYYYYFKSNSIIDLGISKALENKQNFNENRFMNI